MAVAQVGVGADERDAEQPAQHDSGVPGRCYAGVGKFRRGKCGGCAGRTHDEGVLFLLYRKKNRLTEDHKGHKELGMLALEGF